MKVFERGTFIESKGIHKEHLSCRHNRITTKGLIKVPMKRKIIVAYLKAFKKDNGVFLFGISFFVLKILTFLYYAN